MKKFIVDTHTLLWFITKDKNISKKAKDILIQCDGITSQAVIPTIVLAEFLYLCNKYHLDLDITEIVTSLSESNDFIIFPFNLEIFFKMLKLPQHFEMHDRIIAATSELFQAPILTKDRVLMQSNLVETIW